MTATVHDTCVVSPIVPVVEQRRCSKEVPGSVPKSPETPHTADCPIIANALYSTGTHASTYVCNTNITAHTALIRPPTHFAAGRLSSR
jgi:hypothetical protein